MPTHSEVIETLSARVVEKDQRIRDLEAELYAMTSAARGYKELLEARETHTCNGPIYEARRWKEKHDALAEQNSALREALREVAYFGHVQWHGPTQAAYDRYAATEMMRIAQDALAAQPTPGAERGTLRESRTVEPDDEPRPWYCQSDGDCHGPCGECRAEVGIGGSHADE